MQNFRTTLEMNLPCDYLLKTCESPEVVILIHGYNQDANRFYKKLKPALPNNKNILVPNGPFPIPKFVKDHYEIGFSWYFFDKNSKTYFIDQTPAREFLKNLLHKLGFLDKSVTIVGYSQGGYLAPFLGQSLPNTQQVIALAAEYLPKLNDQQVKFRCDSIFGSNDEFVNPNHIAENFKALKLKQKTSGEISGHQIDENYLSRLKLLLTS